MGGKWTVEMIAGLMCLQSIPSLISAIQSARDQDIHRISLSASLTIILAVRWESVWAVIAVTLAWVARNGSEVFPVVIATGASYLSAELMLAG